jgi:ABC-2 type transport system ATP-binding protein
MKPGEVLA